MRIPGIWRVQNKLKDIQMHFLSRNMHLVQEEHILVFTDPRSGSTWLAEILCEITGKPMLWEPLHLEKGKKFSSLGFTWRQHIPEEASWPEAKKLFAELFEGKLLNQWISIHTNADDLKKANSAVIKFVRANAMLPWLMRNFNFKYKPIYLIRNPFAVVSSQIKKGWNYNIDKLYDDKLKFNAYYEQHLDYLSSLESKEEGLIAFWCLSNKPSLDYKNRKQDVITVQYEDLILQPQETLSEILREWKLEYDLTNFNFKKPSSTVSDTSPLSGKDQIDLWKSSFNSKEIEKMQAVLNHFGITEYSA